MNLKSIMGTEQTHIHQVYQRIIILALLVHTIYAIMFWFFDLHFLTYYHIISNIFYLGMLYCVKLEKFRITVSAIHIEVCIFVVINTLLCGWEAGFALYLIALATLVYFCPFDHPIIPYLFSLCDLLVFFMIKFLLIPHYNIVTALPNSELNVLYFVNAIAAFFIILYAALISNVSAATTKQVLLDDNQNLKQIADHDQLTDLLTRHYLLDKINNLDLNEQKVVVVMSDIDNFKQINDQHGHPCGDYILQTLALLIKTHLPEDTDICRWGGEEFVIVTYQLDKEKVLALIENLCHIINDYHFIYRFEQMRISMTFGVAYCNENNDFNKLIDIADKRLYIGKNNGKNIVVDHN